MSAGSRKMQPGNREMGESPSFWRTCESGSQVGLHSGRVANAFTISLIARWPQCVTLPLAV